jgi:uncharacterized protein (DUF952 family)
VTASAIFHIARAADWEDAQKTGEYRVSTLGRTLEEEGFIHCSADGAQGATVLHNYYARVEDPLVVLTIDTERVPSEIRYEVPDGASDAFPHIYGPLPVDAVVAIAPVPRADDGQPTWPNPEAGA